ncbi:MAG: NIPSNAP family protein [Bryobacter sp.]|nr:NIPSNAP family protein [Bryobacter sp. CoA8 C33]
MVGVDRCYEAGPVYAMQQFFLENGEQLGRLNAYLKDALLPALRQAAGPGQLVLEAIVAAHQPQVVFLQQFADVASWREVSLQLKEDKALRAATDAWSQANPYRSHGVSLLAATGYCPPLEGIEGAQRVFEMRVYEAASEWQLNGVHERFAGPEIPIFHRCGIHPLLYATTIAGAQMPNLTYLTPFDSLAGREAAWSRFQADPEWRRVRQASIESHGFAPRVITISLFKASLYSPVK